MAVSKAEFTAIICAREVSIKQTIEAAPIPKFLLGHMPRIAVCDASRGKIGARALRENVLKWVTPGKVVPAEGGSCHI